MEGLLSTGPTPFSFPNGVSLICINGQVTLALTKKNCHGRIPLICSVICVTSPPVESNCQNEQQYLWPVIQLGNATFLLQMRT